MTPKLSICIPTYNRADYLPTALESVLGQMNDRVEIVICDNGSIDTTPELVVSYLNKYPEITSFRFSQNIGPDRCFLKSIEIAKGEYCWFLGDDDIIETGSIEFVLSVLDEHPDLSGISVNCKMYDLKLQRELSRDPFKEILPGNKLYLDAPSCLKDLFTYFGYLSAQICKRSLWNQAVYNTEHIEQHFNAYIILYVIAKVVLTNPEWLFLHDTYVRYRSGNDSFLRELGTHKRFLLDALGYEQLARALFGKGSYLYLLCLNQVCRYRLKSDILDIRLNNKVKNFAWRALKALFPHYWTLSVFWYKNLPLLLMPRPLFLLIRKGYQLFLKPYLNKSRAFSQ